MKRVMDTMPGREVASPMAQLTEHEDLVYYEGPIITRFTGPAGEEYLALWTDSDDTAIRWMLVPVKSESLASYKGGKTTLREIVLAAPDVLLFDLHGEIQYRMGWIVPSASLPEDYLPGADSYYSSAA